MFEAATFVGSPSTAFIRNVPPQVGAWRVTTVFVAVVNPDNTSATIEAKKGGDGVWTATIPATNTSGRVAGGFQVLADGIDENGDAVTGYVLGVADFAVFELEVTADPGRGGASSVLRYFTTAPTIAKAGDVAKFDGVLKFYDGSAWIPFAAGGGGDLPAPVAPSEATEPGQYADALATKGELAAKAAVWARQYIMVTGGETGGMPTLIDVDAGEIRYDDGTGEDAEVESMPNSIELLGRDAILEVAFTQDDEGIDLVFDGSIMLCYPSGLVDYYEQSVSLSDLLPGSMPLRVYAALFNDGSKTLVIEAFNG